MWDDTALLKNTKHSFKFEAITTKMFIFHITSINYLKSTVLHFLKHTTPWVLHHAIHIPHYQDSKDHLIQPITSPVLYYLLYLYS